MRIFLLASTCLECRCILAIVMIGAITGMVVAGVNRAGGTSIMARADITAHRQGRFITAPHVVNGVMAHVITACHHRHAITNGITAREAHAGNYNRISWRNALTLLRLTGTSKSRSLSRRI